MTALADSITRIEAPAKAFIALRRPGERVQVGTVTTRPGTLRGKHVGRQSSRIWRHLRAPDGDRY